VADLTNNDGSGNNDVIDGTTDDELIQGFDGHDELRGGYGDDQLYGGAGNDTLIGGRGSDLLDGGDGDDLLISRSDSGEQRIGQLVLGNPTRPDPDNEVNYDRLKLKGWEGQPLVGDDVMTGGGGRDTFLISPQINAKLGIIEEHVRDDGTIKWSSVAHENDELHDHWVDSSGIDIITDYNASEDHIAIIGHTANIEVEHVDVDGDGDDESVITIYSNQANGGAHTQDLLGQAIVFGDKVNAEDIVTDAGVTYGMVENYADVDEAINPTGELKTSGPNGEVIGYDTRDANGNEGLVTGNPFAHSDNPYLDSVTYAAPSEAGPNYDSRAFFDQQGFDEVAGDTYNGDDTDNVLTGEPAAAPATGLPGALAYWTFANGIDGGFANERSGGPEALAYRLYENQALLQTAMPLTEDQNGNPDSALVFNGEDTFGFIGHDPSVEVTQGTVSVWIRPDHFSDWGGKQIVLSKDQSGAGDGGHFRLGHDDDGRIFLRFADGDGGSNKSWTSSQSYLTEGQWSHLAVSFTADGITVYVDGNAVPDYAWYRQEGNLDSPAQATEAYLLENREPWILGANTSHTKENDTAAAFATDEEHLCDAFEGAMADFGVWGGFEPDSALDAGQVWQLYTEGPGDALTAPSGIEAIVAADDVLNGFGGNDQLDGAGGDDEINGGAGNDSLEGGYGDDILDGGTGNDVLEGGRGSDLLLGGDGDDTLVSRSDSGEQRIGQLVIGEPTREDPDGEVNADAHKLYGWEDQPLIGDDIMVGGAGADTFLFNPQINAKRDIILEHVNDDRTIDWAAVAGENNELHDHWVDSFGIDVIADYRADEDEIVIVGHTATPEVEHKLIDTDGDGEVDEAISVITVYSNQGGGGGAHTEDLIGQIVVHGDLVDEDAIVRVSNKTHGIVDTVDEIQEALAPTGETKTSVLSDGTTFAGYDSRDDEGNLGEVIENPELYVNNPNANSDLFEYAGNLADDVPVAVAVIDALSHPELDNMVFSGNPESGAGGAYVSIAHENRAANMAQTTGTIAFSFVADNPNGGKQALFSKDAYGYQDGGHLTAWIDEHGCVDVRYQSTSKSLYFKADSVEHLEAGVEYHLAFTFAGNEASLYLNGELQETKDLSDYPGFLLGMSGNAESLVFGANAWGRTPGTVDKLDHFFDGSIDDVVVADRALNPVEIFKLVAAEGDFAAVGLDSTHALNTPPDEIQIPPADAVGDVAPTVISDFTPTVGTDFDETIDGIGDNELILGLDGDDIINGNGGHDELRGGYGDDQLYGGAGNDTLIGGRGSDLLDGGDGDDLLISRSDSGEQRIGQLVLGNPTRPDPDNEVNYDRLKLKGWEGQPLVGDDVMTGGGGRDTFLISPQINAKLGIIEEHVRDDGTIKWSSVAHENDELHDHWVDSSGIDIITDYNASEDHIAIIGHTANIEVEHVDVDGDGDDESVITIYSNQANGGAHTQDLLGQAIVFGDKVNAEDIVTDAGVTYGMVENYADVDEAINPTGELKTSGPNGEVIGYDTRDANGNEGLVTGNPFAHSDNPYLDSVTYAAPSEAGPNYDSRAFFDQQGFDEVAGDTYNGDDTDNVLTGEPAAAPATGLPGALAYWTFANGIDGGFANERSGGPEALAYRLYENQALLQTAMPLTEDQNGNPDSALVFNGEDTFGFIGHDPSVEVTQGTVSVWIRPDHFSDWGGKQIVLSKDQSGAGDGGHFRLGHDDDGRIFLRFAEGDGGSNKSWTSSQSYLTEGQWSHLAVSFTADGITVYVDGNAVPDYAWYRQEGNLDSPAQATEAYLLENREPWILGANTSHTEENDTAAGFATDDEHLCDAFEGAMADFGVWGGFEPDSALDAGQVWQLYTEGPGDALTAPSGIEAIVAADDVLNGYGGNDQLDGAGGDDEINGGAGNDSLEGGYGDDILDGGTGNDVLEGGRGSDLLLGGDGDDTLVSRSDSGEQRIGQLVIGEPTREDPDGEVNEAAQKLYGWEDQPLVGDDIMVGGAGADTFLFNPQINAKRDIILEHVNDDRTIDWAAVAGENNELHDHWVDSFGIDVIADYRADEDEIVIVGHTATPEVEHKFIDTDGDGEVDEAISVITVYSNQGGGGGAHTEDLIGQIVVHGDLVDEDAIVRVSNKTHGIVETVDEIQEALAPTGETKTSVLSDGTPFTGYDSRDDEGNLGEIIENPELYVNNPNANSDLFEYAGNVPEGIGPAHAVIDELSHPALDQMTVTGNEADGEGGPGVPGAYFNIAHEGRAAAMAQTAGTIAFSFVADNPSGGKQALFSKDASGYVDGGHLTAWIDEHGCVDLRYQSTEKSIYMKADGIEHLQAGVEYHFAFSFDGSSASLYLNGELQATKDLSEYPEFAAGMSGNTESLVFGSATWWRTSGEVDNLSYYFDGSFDDVLVLDRPLYGAEAYQLAAGILDYEPTDVADPPIGEDPNDPPVGEDPNDPPVGEDPNDPPIGEDPNDPPVGEDPNDPPVGEDPNDPPVGEDPNDPPVGEDPNAPPVGEDPNDPPVGEDPSDPPVGEDPSDPPVGEDPNDPPVGEDPNDPPVGEDPNDPPVGEDPNDPPVGEDPNDPPNGENSDIPGDELPGTRGKDLLVGTSRGDHANGGRGSDFISGLGGNDVLAGGMGADTIFGGDGDDTIDGGGGADLIIGGEGADIIDGGNGNDRILGGLDDDVIDGGIGADEIFGGEGSDTIEGGGGADLLMGGKGTDVIAGGNGNDKILGGSGNDALDGGIGADSMFGGDGHDSMDGGGGADLIHGGSGADSIDGGNGSDRILGGLGNDVIEGGSGADSLFGGGGHDTIDGGGGADTIIGGGGKDRIDGGSGHDVIVGGMGDDALSGGSGRDVISGNRGNDVIEGGAGNDDLTGGRGKDAFVFETPTEGSLGLDVIRDFRSGQDKLMVSGDLTLLFDEKTDFTKISIQDGEGTMVGRVHVYGDALDQDQDVMEISGASDDLFA